MKKIVFAALVCCALVAHAAEPSSGKLSGVAGTVSVGGQGSTTQAVDGMKLFDGSAVSVSSKGKATVELDNGCIISLLGSQRLVVDSKLSCDMAIASITTGATPYGAVGTGVGVGTVLGVAAVIYLGSDLSKDSKASGS